MQKWQDKKGCANWRQTSHWLSAFCYECLFKFCHTKCATLKNKYAPNIESMWNHIISISSCGSNNTGHYVSKFSNDPVTQSHWILNILTSDNTLTTRIEQKAKGQKFLPSESIYPDAMRMILSRELWGSAIKTSSVLGKKLSRTYLQKQQFVWILIQEEPPSL